MIKATGTNLSDYIFKQLPVLPKDSIGKFPGLEKLLRMAALELVYTSVDLTEFARECDYTGRPFRWSNQRREILIGEIDSAVFHLYGIDRATVDYILSTFPIVKRKDEEQYGEYRTKRVIMEIYDEMQHAVETSKPYQTRLNPPPADTRVAHSAR